MIPRSFSRRIRRSATAGRRPRWLRRRRPRAAAETLEGRVLLTVNVGLSAGSLLIEDTVGQPTDDDLRVSTDSDTGEYVNMPRNFDEHPHQFVLPSGHTIIWRHPPRQLLRRFGRDMSNTSRSVINTTIHRANSICYPCTEVGPPPVSPTTYIRVSLQLRTVPVPVDTILVR